MQIDIQSCPLRAVDVTVSEEIANMCLKHVFFEGKREKMEHRVSNGVDGPLKLCSTVSPAVCIT